MRHRSTYGRGLPVALVLAVAASLAGAAEAPDPAPAPVGSTHASFSGVGTDRPYAKTNLFKRVWRDQKFLVLHWWPAEFTRVGFSAPLIAATAAAATSSGDDTGLDLAVESSVQRFAGGGSNGLAEGLTFLGDTYTGAALIGATYLGARLAGNDHLARATSLSAEALINVAIWSTVLKELTARTRPASGGRGEFFVYNPGDAREPTSFPSGHAMGAFAVATVLADEYPQHRWLPWLAYGLAGMIAGSRVALGRHFVSDVVVGAVLGHSLGKMVEARQRGEDPRRGGHLEPIFDPASGGYGLAYRYTW